MDNFTDNEMPKRVVAPIVLSIPNEDVQILKGIYEIRQFQQKVIVKGSIKFVWFPMVKIIFEGEVIDGREARLSHHHDLELIVNNQSIAIGKLYYRSFGDDINPYFLEGHSFRCLIGESNIPVNECNFSLANLREWYGGEVIDTATGMVINGRITFNDDLYAITLDKMPNFSQLHGQLHSKGGFTILYSGKIIKKEGVFLPEEIRDFNFCLAHFLYFMNGQRTAPLFIAGIVKNSTIWMDYPSHSIQQYKKTHSWSEHKAFNDVSELWLVFRDLWKSPVDKDFLMTVLHWYVEANAGSAFVEGSIILAQTALELVFNWLIVENKKMITKKDAKKQSAASKIKVLLKVLGASFSIPPNDIELANINKIDNGPEAFVLIRNALVHGDLNKRRNILMQIDSQAKFQALKLGIWYIELSLLYILGYNDTYFNTAFHQNEKVPWAV